MREPSAFGGVAACSVGRHVGSQDFSLRVHAAGSPRDANPKITTNSVFQKNQKHDIYILKGLKDSWSAKQNK